MLLRDETEVALNDLAGLATTSAETFETAARVIAEHDPQLAEMFGEMAAERRRMAGELRTQDRRMGDVPHAVDPDYTTLHDLFVRLRGLFAADERQALIDECQAGDRAIAERLITALELPLPPAIADTLRKQQYEITAALGRLAATRARL